MLLLGGVIAAPLSAWLVRRFDDQALATGVGGLIIVLNLDRGLSLFGVAPDIAFPLRIAAAVLSVIVVAYLLLRSRTRRAAAAAESPAAW